MPQEAPVKSNNNNYNNKASHDELGTWAPVKIAENKYTCSFNFCMHTSQGNLPWTAPSSWRHSALLALSCTCIQQDILHFGTSVQVQCHQLQQPPEIDWANLHVTWRAAYAMQSTSEAGQFRSMGNSQKAILMHAERLAGQTLLSGLGAIWERQLAKAAYSSVHPSHALQHKPAQARAYIGSILDEVCEPYFCSFSGCCLTSVRIASMACASPTSLW